MKTKPTTQHTGRTPAVFDMSSDLCVWSTAGVIAPTRCINAFDCLGCPLHKRLKKDVAAGRLKNGRAPMDLRMLPEKGAAKAEQMKCRHMLSGRVSYKYCIHNYECQTCAFNQMMEDEILSGPQGRCRQQIVSGFALADHYYYHPAHAWARVEYGGFLRVGMDDFAARVFGPFDRIRLPKIGTVLGPDRHLCTLMRNQLQACCLSPVAGVVVAVNPGAEAEKAFPEWAPYDQGWLVMIEPLKRGRQLRHLLFGEKSRLWLEKEAAALSAMIAPEAGYQLAASGGRAISDIYGQVPNLDWRQLTARFLHT